ncbi:formate--tetrahydrofolate ligase [Nannocystaceae bacterium ST9]
MTLAPPPSDAVIAQTARLAPITAIAAKLGLPEDALELYGRHKAKVSLAELDRRRREHPRGKLVLVTAMTATRFGDGKTLTSIALAQGLGRLGQSCCLALREPSLGPIFGIKGGAAGGGYSQVVPMTDINLHFTGDLHAITAANNLLAAVVDNRAHFELRAIGKGKPASEHDLDPERISWRRVLDICDRQLRNCQLGLGGPSEGFPHASGFDITAASEIMAVLALARDRGDLQARLSRIVVGWTRGGRPVRAHELDCVGALEVLLKDALAPNLVQTLEQGPALIHCGPFANIAHGCNSRIATELAMHAADWAVTEAGFAADLGAEKFLAIKCRELDCFPAVAVLVVTCRALKLHGEGSIVAGFANVQTHLDNLREHYGLPVVVAINRFGFDGDDELAEVARLCDAAGVPWALGEGHARGGEGTLALAEAVVAAGEAGNRPQQQLYSLELPLREKVERIATAIYRADGVDWTEQAERELALAEAAGGASLPVCMAKTQHSLSDDPERRGAPRGWRLKVAGVRLSAGAGFVVVRTGALMLMPGMPEQAGATKIRLDDDGTIVGLGG